MKILKYLFCLEPSRRTKTDIWRIWRGRMILDPTDKKIVNVLLTDARLSYRQIGKRVGVSVATVMNRVKRLETEGVIKRYSALIDFEKLEYEIHAIIELRIAKGKLFEVERKVATHASVQAVYDHTGASDCTVLAWFRNTKALDTFVKELQTYDFVERTETRLVLNTLKEDGMQVR